jgi:hypothetical protein
MTASGLGRWVNRAERGESFVYAVGDGRRPPPEGVMKAARELHAKGLIALVQRRERTGDIAYVAQRTWKKVVPA